MGTSKPLVAVTMGDPAGIGPEVACRAAPQVVGFARVVVVGDAALLSTVADAVDAPLSVRRVETPAAATAEPTVLSVLDCGGVDDHEWGVVRADCGAASLRYVERAVDLATAGAVDAVATAPINKRATRLAGSDHAGHTGLLAERTGTEDYAMLLIADDLRVSHVSTHVPLRRACELVTTDRVATTVRLTDDALRELGVDDPSVAVAGLNPHAGEDGLFGETDREEVAPAVEATREAGVDVTGPVSPDTVYVRAARGEFDCVVSMYHDQGHIPVKLLGFDEAGVSGVNVTAGLPVVRTSVDHGTAFDIAGEWVASERSMVEAVRVAADVARSRAAD
jgi:4-hydroxythreonine-4-phosphate dehydrogenase